MSTNNRDQLASVTTLTTLQRRYRLEDLLERRYETAVIAIEQLSHNTAEADETFDRLLEIENTVEAEYPDTFAEAWPRWVADDASRLHGPGVLVIGCSICRNIATAKGINLQSPEAA